MNFWKIVLPLLVLALGAAGSCAIMAGKPSLRQEQARAAPPLVSAIRVQPKRLRLDVRSQGVATPRSEIELAAEVAGRVAQVSPQFLAGGFFERGEVLLTVDPRDYDLAVVQAEARLAEARRLVAFEEAQAGQAREEWQALGEGKPSPLNLHLPQLAEARAKLKAAEAELAKAELQRSRCEIRAPFAGRLREKRVDLGQSVQPGEKLGRLYATDFAEVRLPLSAEQLGWLNLPLGRPAGAGPKVRLRADFAGGWREWQGRIVRTEGALDEATGMLHAVAEVAGPYAGKNSRTPLLAGLFVQANIEGREQAGLFELPAAAVNSRDEALIADAEDRLRVRRLDVLRHEAGRVLVKGGLQAGERVVVSGVQAPVEGMKLRVEEAKP